MCYQEKFVANFCIGLSHCGNEVQLLGDAVDKGHNNNYTVHSVMSNDAVGMVLKKKLILL